MKHPIEEEHRPRHASATESAVEHLDLSENATEESSWGLIKSLYR